MYVATFALQYKPWLVRVDVMSLGEAHVARFTHTDRDGSVNALDSPVGPDEFGVGLPSLAVIELIHQLNFAGIDGGINIVHASPDFSQELLDLILAQMCKGLAIQSLATTDTLQ